MTAATIKNTLKRPPPVVEIDVVNTKDYSPTSATSVSRVDYTDSTTMSTDEFSASGAEVDDHDDHDLGSTAGTEKRTGISRSNSKRSKNTTSATPYNWHSTWSNINLNDANDYATTEAPPDEVLIERNSSMIEELVVNVMNWRHKLTQNRLKRHESSVGMAVFSGTDITEGHHEHEQIQCLPKDAKMELDRFVRMVAIRYNNVRYHNFEHASHVTACVHQLVVMLQNSDYAEGQCGEGQGHNQSHRRRSSGAADTSTSSETSSFFRPELTIKASSVMEDFLPSNPIVHLALVITALIHDVEHQGIGNKQLVDEGHDLAVKYEGSSVAENNSFDVSSSILFQDEFQHLIQCMFGSIDIRSSADQDLSSVQQEKLLKLKNEIQKEIESYKSFFYKISHDVIMSTDISCPTRRKIGKLKWALAFEEEEDAKYMTFCGKKANVYNDSELNLRTQRRLTFPTMSRKALPRRQSAPHYIVLPTEFIADPFPEQQNTTPEFKRDLLIPPNIKNNYTEITCPLCKSSCSRDDAFKCFAYTRVSALLEQIIQTADVGHTMQSWPVLLKWNEKLYNELWVANMLKRGPDCKDKDKWFAGQIAFFENYIFPLATRLKECGVFGSFGSLFLENATLNRDRWLVEGEELCRQMQEDGAKLFSGTN